MFLSSKSLKNQLKKLANQPLKKTIKREFKKKSKNSQNLKKFKKNKKFNLFLKKLKKLFKLNLIKIRMKTKFNKSKRLKS